MQAPRPFNINTAQSVLDDIFTKIRHYRWPRQIELRPGEDPWDYGTDWGYLKTLCEYWLQAYDWRRAEAQLNRFPQFTAVVDGMEIHFIHERGSGSNPQTLLLTHGWPGSFYEFNEVIEPLAHPERFGGVAEDGVNVIVPSLIGFGYSCKPKRPVGPARIAALWDKLVRETLGYESYVAQGGDWGSVVSAHLGYQHALELGGGCRAVHVNMCGVLPGDPPRTPEELEWVRKEHELFDAEGAYIYIQHTKPQTLAFALMDNPVGQAAWIIEKFHRWSDRRGDTDSIENAFSKDQLLTNVMIYLITGTFDSAAWIYRALFEEGSRHFAPGRRVEVPVGMAVAPREFMVWPPRAYLDKAYNIVRWRQMPRGGHFLAMETGDLFVQEIRAFLKDLHLRDA